MPIARFFKIFENPWLVFPALIAALGLVTFLHIKALAGFSAETQDIMLFLDIVWKHPLDALWFDGRAPLIFPDGVFLWLIDKVTHNVIVTSIVYTMLAVAAFLAAAAALMKSRLTSWPEAMILMAIAGLFIIGYHQVAWGEKAFLFFARWHSSALSFGLGIVWLIRYLVFDVTDIKSRHFKWMLALLVVWVLSISTSDRILYSYILLPSMFALAFAAVNKPYRRACLVVIAVLSVCIVFTNIFISLLPYTNFIPTDNKDTAFNSSWYMFGESVKRMPELRKYFIDNTNVLARLACAVFLLTGLWAFFVWVRRAMCGCPEAAEKSKNKDAAAAKLQDEFTLIYATACTIGSVLAPMIFGGGLLTAILPFYIAPFPIMLILFAPLAVKYIAQHVIKREVPLFLPAFGMLLCLFFTIQGARDGIKQEENVSFNRPLNVQSFHFGVDHFAFYNVLHEIFGDRTVNGVIPYHLQSMPDVLSNGRYHIAYVSWFAIPHINNIAPAFFLDDTDGVWKERVYNFVLAGYAESPANDLKMSVKEVIERFGLPKEIIPIGAGSPIGEKVAARIDSHYKFSPESKILIYDPPINPGYGRLICEQAYAEYNRWVCLLPDSTPEIQNIFHIYSGLGIDDVRHIPSNIHLLTRQMGLVMPDPKSALPPLAFGYWHNYGRKEGKLVFGPYMKMKKPGPYCVRWSVSLSGKNPNSPRAVFKVASNLHPEGIVSHSLDLSARAPEQSDKLCFENQDKDESYEFPVEFSGVDGKLVFNGVTLETLP